MKLSRSCDSWKCSTPKPKSPHPEAASAAEQVTALEAELTKQNARCAALQSELTQAQQQLEVAAATPAEYLVATQRITQLETFLLGASVRERDRVQGQLGKLQTAFDALRDEKEQSSGHVWTLRPSSSLPSPRVGRLLLRRPPSKSGGKGLPR